MRRSLKLEASRLKGTPQRLESRRQSFDLPCMTWDMQLGTSRSTSLPLDRGVPGKNQKGQVPCVVPCQGLSPRGVVD